MRLHALQKAWGRRFGEKNVGGRAPSPSRVEGVTLRSKLLEHHI